MKRRWNEYHNEFQTMAWRGKRREQKGSLFPFTSWESDEMMVVLDSGTIGAIVDILAKNRSNSEQWGFCLALTVIVTGCLCLYMYVRRICVRTFRILKTKIKDTCVIVSHRD